ncbi:MAG: hypothetical protein JWP69_1549 [Flaviaesturariibacter sp.]|nr:hypothetical protein [Flaviaesturariibacter sp.]
MDKQEQAENNAAWQREQPTYSNEPDQTPRREGGDDALAEASPTDPLDDQKVLVNDPKTSVEDNKTEGDASGKMAD